MKQFLTLFMAILAIGCAYAQQTVVATLSKASTGEVTQYYGATGLIDAYADAETGDAIYLSPGTFHSVNLGKVITICGAGMTKVTGEESTSTGTTIVNDFTINFEADSLGNKFRMEGVTCSGIVTINGFHGGLFLRCTFANTIKDSKAKIISDCSIINCVLNDCQLSYASNGIVFQNSYLYQTQFNSGTHSFDYKNCVLEDENTRFQTVCSGSSFTNCIIKSNSTSSWPNSTFYNNIFVGGFSLASSSVGVDNSTISADDYDSLFQDGTFYKLTDTAAATYLGTDGEQVGLYGGFLPFETTPTNPQIVSLTVDSQSTSSGTLPVTIQVK
ncbi:MAG: hypothetical protein LUD17_00230 [Bacteroidales bacterium]|nr:hypothetical protein [Bacteroidales bacterium]